MILPRRKKRVHERSSLCVDVGVCAHCYVCACAGGGPTSLVASPLEFFEKGSFTDSGDQQLG